MTIKVEQEALLRVLEPSINAPLSESEEYLVVDFRKPIGSSDRVVEKLRPGALFDDDDDDSVFTASTASFSDSDSECGSIERRVSFADDLVTDEWVRPFTPKEELPQLFYTNEETQRFRQEYRMERKLLNELSIDPDNFPVDDTEEFSALVASSCKQPTGRHSISRVVVLHNDKLETFFTPPSPQEPTDAFFDNDSFWSGSITWY